MVFQAHEENYRLMVAKSVFWAGDRRVEVHLVDEDGWPVLFATNVTLSLAIDPGVTMSLVTSSGVAVFANLPEESIHVKAQSENMMYFGLGVLGPEDVLTLTLRQIEAPSPVDNNDLRLGTTAGWNALGGANVFVIPHDENPFPGRRMQDMDYDIAAEADGIGSGQGMSRSFQPDPAGGGVVVLFRFTTEEIPEGWFGSQYDDTFSISAWFSGGDPVSVSGSMNSLGRAAFSKSGSTDWMELRLPLSGESGDPGTVQVDASAANVGDDLYPAAIIVRCGRRQDGRAHVFLSASGALAPCRWTR